jgi:hypothetical protein
LAISGSFDVPKCSWLLPRRENLIPDQTWVRTSSAWRRPDRNRRASLAPDRNHRSGMYFLDAGDLPRLPPPRHPRVAEVARELSPWHVCTLSLEGRGGCGLSSSGIGDVDARTSRRKRGTSKRIERCSGMQRLRHLRRCQPLSFRGSED